MSSGNEIPSNWTTAQERNEELLRKMADETGGRVERDAAGRLRLIHDPKVHP